MAEQKLTCPKCKISGIADVFRNAGNPVAIIFGCGCVEEEC